MSGFYQIELDERSRNTTSFLTLTASHSYTRLISPNLFQRILTLAFTGLQPSQAYLYMDDLVVVGCSEKHKLKNLSDVVEKNNMKP